MKQALARSLDYPIRSIGVPLACVIAFLAAVGPARGQLVINPTFQNSITSDPNAATIEAGINAMIGRLEAAISNSITVNVTYGETNSGLGQSSTAIGNVTYTAYRNALANQTKFSANDVSALASLPAGPNNPVNGNANVTLTAPLLRALGLGGNVATDSTILLNTSIINLSRTGSQNPSFYDLQAVAGHETDEALGVGGPGSALPTTGGAVGTLDLFRYSALGVRSFTTSTNVASYFSANGGALNLSFYNQSGGGSDYADWGDGAVPADGRGNSPPQMQDAYGTPGTDINIGPAELAELDVIGYTLTSVPEPSTMALVGGCAVLLAGYRRRRAHIRTV